MDIEFISEVEMSRRYTNGEFCHFYSPPYDDMPKDFSEKETQLAIEIENASKIIFGDEHIEANYDSWADVTTRLSVSRSIIGKELFHFLMRWVNDSPVEQCIDCTVLEDLPKQDFFYHGRFVMNLKGVWAEESLKDVLKM